MTRLLIAVCLLWAGLQGHAAAQDNSRVALIIANSEYAGYSPLTNPATDAALIANSLRQAGFGVVEMKDNLDNGAFRAALGRFQVQARSAQVALVYYAGHAVEVGGRNWLIPTDARLASDEELEFQAIDANLLINATSSARARIVVLDACRENPFIGRMRNLSGTATRAASSGLAGASTDKVRGTLLMYSAGPGQLAADGVRGQASPFARAFAQYVSTPGLELRLAAGKISDAVHSETDGRQTPWVSSSLSGDEVYLVAPVTVSVAAANPDTAPKSATVTTPTTPAVAFDTRALELAYWQRCCASADATDADFAGYLAKVSRGDFPGTFADLARPARPRPAVQPPAGQPAPSPAAGPRPLTLGQTVTAALEPAGTRDSDNVLYQDYEIRLAANQNVEFALDARDFDTLVRFGTGTGAAFREIKSDDDGGEGVNARLRVSAPSAGTFTVRASALNNTMQGGFTLASRTFTPSPPPTTRPLAVGQTVSGTLADGGSRLEDGDKLFHQYGLTVRTGERLKIEAQSTAFDAVMELGRLAAGGAYEQIKTDDDSAGNNNPRILAALEPGAYLVRVHGFDAAAAGVYTVRADRVPPPAAAPQPTRLGVGAATQGTFTETSPVINGFKPYNYYVVAGRAGQTITVTMMADFDSYLDVGAFTAGGFAVVASDDDSGGGLNAKLTFTFSETGEIFIRASAVQEGVTGVYTVNVL